MSYYPEGSDNSSAPWNIVETNQDVPCDNDDCKHLNVDATVIWADGVGTTECEECHEDIEIEAPSRWDDI